MNKGPQAESANSTSDVAFILRAAIFAADMHRDQRRKGESASPYINHPLAVAEVLATIGHVTDPVTLAAAILHDTLEDTGATPAEIEERFGAEVLQVVEELTDDKRLEKQVRKQLQVEHAPHLSPRARLVKYGDKICNAADILRDPPVDWPVERKLEYVAWMKTVVDGCRGENAALERRFDELHDAAMRNGGRGPGERGAV